MTADLTPRQKSILDFIIAFQREHRIAPTVREIGEHFGLTGPAGIHRILGVLKEKGYLLSEPGKKRNWRFSDSAAMAGIPLVGTIAAGLPIEAVAIDGDDLPFSPDFFGCQESFGLRVKGDSMIEAHIMDGDLAIIRPQPQVDSGTIAAVLIRDLLPEATLKIVRYTRSVLTLEPANPAYAPMVFKGPQRARVRVLGKYVGIIRKIG